MSTDKRERDASVTASQKTHKTARHFVRAAAALWVLVPLGGATTSAQVPRLPTFTLDEVGIVAGFGLLERDTRPGVALRRTLDAVFLGDRVAVLDNRPPWVRIFDSEGRLLRTSIALGEGPGQTRRPYAISATSDGGMLLTHERGLEWLDADGAVIRSLAIGDPALPLHRQPFRLIGAVEACGGDLVLQLESRSLPSPQGSSIPPTVALVRARATGELADTLAIFSATRNDSRVYHPWIVDSAADRLLVYTEETGVARLVELDCDNARVTEIPIDSLGAGVEVSPIDANGRFVVRTARPPYPAGMARLDDRLLWATRVIRSGQDGGQDSVTVVTSIEEGEPPRQIALQGWFQLLDAASDGSLLLGNSWPLGLNWEYGESWNVRPAAFRIDGSRLREIIDQVGVSRLVF